MNTGNLEIVKNEMERLDISVLGIIELHWTGNGYFTSGEFTVFYSGNDNIRRNGVAFITNKNTGRAVESFRAVNDRLLTIRINGKSRGISIMQTYTPTSDATDEQSEKFYADIQQAFQNIPKNDIVFIMGDFNAKIGVEEDLPIARNFGLGERNDAGDRLSQFCQENRLAIMNMFFAQPKRRLYTWTSPNGNHRNQIDFILCPQKRKTSVLTTKTFSGSDHELLVAKLKLRFCKIKKQTMALKFDTNAIPPAYAIEVKTRFELLDTNGKEPDELREEIKSAIMETAMNHIPTKKLVRKAPWITANTIDIAEKR